MLWGVFFGHFLSDVAYSNGLTVAAEDYPNSCLNFSSAISPETKKKKIFNWTLNGNSRQSPDLQLDVTGCHFKR